MTPLYAARVENLMPGRHVGIDCMTGGHLATLSVPMIRSRLPGHVFIQSLSRHVQCRRCGNRNARIVVGWTLGHEDPLVSVTPEDAAKKV